MRGAHLVERRPRTPLDLAGRSARVLDAERHLGEDAVEDDLVLGILEERGDGAGELGRPRAPGVAAADLDAASEAAPVKVRHEAGKSARISVVLPQPERPASSTISPGATSSETSASAGRSAPRSP